MSPFALRNMIKKFEIDEKLSILQEVYEENRFSALAAKMWMLLFLKPAISLGLDVRVYQLFPVY